MDKQLIINQLPHYINIAVCVKDLHLKPISAQLKRLLLSFVLMVTICIGAFAQQLTYQSVIRDASQQLLVNTAVKANFTINFTSGTPFTAEVVASTNAYGLLSVQFGDNTLLGRDWTDATMTVSVRNNATPSIIYLDNESRSVNAVPYALSVNGQSIQTYLDAHNYIDANQIHSDIEDSLDIVRDTLGKHRIDIHRLRVSTNRADSALSARIDTAFDAIGDTSRVLRARIDAIIIPTTVAELTDASDYVTTGTSQTISGNKTFSGKNGFTGKSSFSDTVTVPSGFAFGTTTSATCGNVAVNACDLLNVFDSVQHAIVDLRAEVRDLRDTVNQMRSVQQPKCLFISCTSTYTEVSATAIFNDNDAAITSYTFYFSQNADMSDKTSYASSINSYTFTGLHPGRNYYVTATATNSQGTGRESSIYWIKTKGDPPTVATNLVSSIAPLSAVGSGNVTGDGGVAVTERGICWRTGTTAPTLSNSHISNGTGTGVFSCSMTNLTPSTQYSVRAYAINLVDTSYGNTVTFTTAAPVPPTVTTSSTVSNIAGATATCGGIVTAQGTYSVTSRGLCWSLSQNPTISDAHSTVGSGTGSFTSELTGLTPDRVYYVRAYATSSAGTSYGEQISFRSFVCGTTKIADIDGNEYNTLLLGTQCWLKENLRTSRYSDGTSISLSTDVNVSSTTTAYRYYPSNSSAYLSWGYLYNWKAVMRNSSATYDSPSGVQGICPVGWHVPSLQEFEHLYSFVSSQPSWGCDADDRYYDIPTSYVKALAAADDSWGRCDNCIENCAPYPHPNTNNASGFSMYPTKYFDSDHHIFQENIGAFLWSTTVIQDNQPKSFGLGSTFSEVLYGRYDKADGLGVRCIHD